MITKFAATLKGHDSAAARGLIGDIDAICPPRNRVAARARLGLLVARLIHVERRKGSDLQNLYDQGMEYLPYADHWELRAALGSLALESRKHKEATEHYFRSLELMVDSGYTPKAPAAETIRSVHDAASEALALNEIPVEPTTRGGSTAAYFARSVRGIGVPKKTPQITFVTDSDAFDSRGRTTADRLLPILRRETPTEITIIGHTDERGEDAYNLDLSQRRTARIREHLRESGFRGNIWTIWCGERVPVQIDSPRRFSQEERWRINRRVEVFYGQASSQQRERYNACVGS